MKLTEFYSFILVGLLALCCPLPAQDTTNFFPHQVGDFWEYYFTDFVGDDTIQVEVVKDSVDQKGFHYIVQAARSINPLGPPEPFSFDTTKFILDTTKQVFTYFSFGDGPLLKYKLDASKGEQWVIWKYQNGGFEMARVSRIWQDTVFGIPTTIKSYDYYAASDTTDTLGLARHTDWLSDKFGLIYRFVAEGGWSFFLKGAVLEGNTYGDTTLVGIRPSPSSPIPIQINLYQNYPNPFNPQTSIPLELKKSAHISLVIYDAVGRAIRKLIDNEWYMAGEHEFKWDGKTGKGGDAASGVYFYQLISGQQRLTRRMLLIR